MSNSKDSERKPNIFISYCRKDADIAESLSLYCRSGGANTWLANADIEKDSAWMEQLLEAVNKSNVVIVLNSHGSLLDDNWQRKEWSTICELKWKQPEVHVIPIKLDDSELPAFLRGLNALQARDNTELFDCMERVSNIWETEGTKNSIVFSGDELDELKERFRTVLDAVSRESSDENSDSNPLKDGNDDEK